MGTPDFAVPSLDILMEHGYNIVGVITAVDKPAGRGRKLHQSAIKKYATAKGLNVLQPKNLKDKAFIENLKSLKADLQIVVAFRMLPEVVWDMPPLGTFNLHASLLPQYRGAAPINWVVINGEKETGATTFFLKHEIDTGDLILQKKLPINNTDTAGDIHDKLMILGSKLVFETVQLIEKGNFTLYPQETNDIELKSAPKIFSKDCKIDWNETSENIYNKIRGLSPYPVAFTTLANKKLKIYNAFIDKDNSSLPPGSIETDNKTFLKVITKTGSIHIKELQLEGKKRMKTADFLRGYKIESTLLV